MVVGVAGGTCTGKSTLETALQSRFGQDLTVVPFDDFFVPRDVLDSLPINRWDGPDVVRWRDYHDALSTLRSGHSVTIPTHSRESVSAGIENRTIAPTRIVLVAGFLALHDETARSQFDLKLFIDLPESEIVRRRLARAVLGDPWDTPEYVYGNLLEKHDSYVVPQLALSDFVVNGALDPDALAKEVIGHISASLEVNTPQMVLQ